MSVRQWVRVTRCESIPVREGRQITIGGRVVAIFNLGDRYLATSNRCPHRGGPLCDGIVAGASVVCPLHAWKVDLETGRVERPTSPEGACVETYPARIEDGVIVIGVPQNWGPASIVEDTPDSPVSIPVGSVALSADKDSPPQL
jgi:nitrite reductase (NADH) small subunit